MKSTNEHIDRNRDSHFTWFLLALAIIVVANILSSTAGMSPIAA